jgi:hypothetical protein
VIADRLVFCKEIIFACNFRKGKKKMQLLKTKPKLTAVIILAFLIATSFMALSNTPVTQAQFRGTGPPGGTPGPLAPGVVPDIQVQTWALLSVRPTTVGLGQPVLVNLETQPAPGTDRHHQDYLASKTGWDYRKKVLESYLMTEQFGISSCPTSLDNIAQFELLTFLPAGLP